MSRVNIAIVVAAAGLLLVVGNAQVGKGPATPTATGPVGRISIIDWRVSVYAESAVKQQGVFRIDTVTGKTSMYAVGLNSQGKLVEYWHQIDESLKPPQ